MNHPDDIDLEDVADDINRDDIDRDDIDPDADEIERARKIERAGKESIERAGKTLASLFGTEKADCPRCRRPSLWLRRGQDLQCVCQCDTTPDQQAALERARARTEDLAPSGQLTRPSGRGYGTPHAERLDLARRASICHAAQLGGNGRCALAREYPECRICLVTTYLCGNDEPPASPAESRKP